MGCRPMSDVSDRTAHLQRLIDHLRRGDSAAREKLLADASDGLRRLTRRMFREERRLKRWEETDDVFQNSTLRLYRALADVQPATVRDFFRLAALHIRRELIDLARHYYGPEGLASHHHTHPPERARNTAVADPCDVAETTHEASRLARWADFHEQIAMLPENDRELFDLLWYQGLNQDEAAALLGISERTLQRRWQSVRLRLHGALKGERP
jgi:RNA polymerase sigma factor (sigma-70 family)